MICYTLTIDGMMCGQCEAHVKQMLEKVPGALQIKANAHANKATINAEKALDERDFEIALAGSGYRLVNVKHEEKKDSFFFKRAAKRQHGR